MTPPSVQIKARLSGMDFEARTPWLIDAAARAGWGEPTRFSRYTKGKERKSPIAKLDVGALVSDQAAVTFLYDDGSLLAVSTVPRLDATLVSGSTNTRPLDTETCLAVVVRQARLLEALFGTGEVREGHVHRHDHALGAVPIVPLAEKRVALVTTEREVEAEYGDARAFWQGWDEKREAGDGRLVSRGLSAATTPAWFERLFEAEWAMARAARPGRTRYGVREAPPGCEAILGAGPSRLEKVGVRDGHVELAATVKKGEHIAPWEVLAWHEVLIGRAQVDGEPVNRVRAVFWDEATARRTGTPLLDIGMEVVFLARDGQYRSIADEQDSATP